MSTIIPQTPSGTLELLPEEQTVFQSTVDTIRGIYELYGFLPLETPVFERTDVLFNKSGGETDKQIYFVQSRGAREQQKAPELGLRFDLTVPLSRYVAEHERSLLFPFRRYQIQRVYRGERPQKGRFREFYQCDIDIIGKQRLSLRYDAEVLTVIVDVFKRLEVGSFSIHLNNRRLLYGILEHFHLYRPEEQRLALSILDKFYKTEKDVTREAFSQLLASINPSQESHILTQQTQDMINLLTLKDKPSTVLDTLLHLNIDTPGFQQGLTEIRSVLEELECLGIEGGYFCLDLSIVRGLDYYTGMIYETFLHAHPRLGSVCSGGRYDDLASTYTSSRLPGVGVSIGLTRLFSYLLSIGHFRDLRSLVEVLVTRIDSSLHTEYMRLATTLRHAGINTVVYGEDDKLSKQLKYAHRSRIPWVVILGEEEKALGKVTLKSLSRGEQKTVSVEELLSLLRHPNPS